MFDECLYDGSGSEPCEYHQQVVVSQCECTICDKCGKEIGFEKGFELTTANYDGEWKVYATCIACMRIRNSLFKGEFTHKKMWKQIHDRYGLTPDGVDESWIPCDRRADGVVVANDYEKELDRLNHRQ